MSRLFGVSTDLILAGMAGITAIVVIWLLIGAGRGLLLLRIGLRNVPRRPIRTVLVTIGLAVSTGVLTSALATGDTMTYNIRSLVTSTIGRVDELVVLYRRAPQRIGPDDLAQIVSGQLVAGSRSYFSDATAQRIVRAGDSEPAIAGSLPAIIEPMVAANLASQQVGSYLNVIGLPGRVPAVFGTFPDADGLPNTMADLQYDEIYLNTIAASALDARAGDPVLLYFGSDKLTVTVRSVVDTTELGADQPALLMGIWPLQNFVKKPASVNRVLIANRGDAVSSVDSTEAAVRALRQVLVRDDSAKIILDILRNDNAQTAMMQARDRVNGVQRDRLDALIRETRNSQVTPEFKTLIGDPETIGRISFVAQALRGTPQGDRLNRSLFEVNSLSVIDIKRAALDRAEEYGAVLTSIFLVVGILSIVAALALVFLVFVLLTSERRGEMGVARAIGMRRNQLITTFVFEGLAYDLIGALIGVGIGVAAGSFAFRAVSGLLTDYGVQIIPAFTPRSLAIAYLGGVLLTLISVGGAAWRISRLNIVAAIRDLPDTPRTSLPALLRGARGGPSAVIAAFGGLVRFAAATGLLALLIGFACRQIGLAAVSWGLFAVGITLVLIGIGQLAAWLVRRWSATAATVALSLAAIATLLFWIDETDLFRFGRWPYPDPDVSSFALRGFAIVLAGVWLACLNLRTLLAILSLLLAPFGALLPAVRLAVTYPALRPWRTALAMAMFAMVIFTMTLASVLLNVALTAYGDPNRGQLGFDIRGEPASSGAPPDVRTGLDTAVAIKSADFTAIGTLLAAPADTLVIDGDLVAWRTGTITLLDNELVDTMRLRLAAWDTRYATSDDTWQAFLSDPTLALASTRGLPTAAGFAPYDAWIRNPAGGTPSRVHVIGVIDSDVGVPAGIAVAQRNAIAFAAEPRSYLFKVAPTVKPEDASLGLTLSFGEAGLKTQIVGQEFRRASAIRTILTYLLEVFLGLGLIAGLAALGVMGVMAVVERRSQIGVLRAIGYRRWLVMFSFVLESTIIAGLGIAVGGIGGVIIAKAITNLLGRTRSEIVFIVPWNELGLIIGVATIASLLMAAIPAQQAGSVRPAEAIKSA